ncbi:MAG: hypothetical protein ACXVXB_12980 [Nocardioidaceae bacterium]
MTEAVGRSARWGTLAVVAPVAAAVFAAATGWGVAHPPATSGKSSSASPVSDPPPADRAAASGPEGGVRLDKPLVALQQRALTEQARVIRLQRTLNRLNARTRAITRAPLPGSAGAASGGGSASLPRSGGGAVAVAGPPRVATSPARAAAPATHTTTGAS